MGFNFVYMSAEEIGQEYVSQQTDTKRFIDRIVQSFGCLCKFIVGTPEHHFIGLVSDSLSEDVRKSDLAGCEA